MQQVVLIVRPEEAKQLEAAYRVVPDALFGPAFALGAADDFALSLRSVLDLFFQPFVVVFRLIVFPQ